MAEAGFYWCGTMQENDAACCFLCGKVLDGWESTDNPWSEHKKHSPQCAFVKLGRPEDDIAVSFPIRCNLKLTPIIHERLNMRLGYMD